MLSLNAINGAGNNTSISQPDCNEAVCLFVFP